MKKPVLIGLVLLAVLSVWYLVWRSMLAEDVARVKASIEYQNHQFREKNRWITFKADKVRPSGFPFHARVRIVRPTLTFVWKDETYGASFPWMDLSARDADAGSYEVTYASHLEAVYAKSGQAPEEYKVTPKEPVAVLVRAQGDSRACPNLPGSKPCAAVGAADPLISYAVKIPAIFTITMEKDGATKDATFKLIPVAIPIYQKIPAEMDRPLELFVNILREAMVFQKDTNFGAP